MPRDLDELTKDELNEALLNPDKLAELTADPSDSFPPEEAPLSAEAAPPPTEETIKAEEEAADKPPEVAPEEEIVSDSDILRAALDAAEARAKHQEQVSGKLGGEVGFLRQKLRALETRIETTNPAVASDDYSVAEMPERPMREQIGPDPTKIYVARQAGEAALIAFAKEHPDFSDKESGMKEAFERHAPEGFDLDAMARQATDPLTLQREIAGSLETAYWRASADVKAARVKSLTERKAVQTASLTRDKLRAVGSASGSPSPVTPKPKSDSELTREEWNQRLRDMTA